MKLARTLLRRLYRHDDASGFAAAHAEDWET
jgi:hypothetical protein